MIAPLWDDAVPALLAAAMQQLLRRYAPLEASRPTAGVMLDSAIGALRDLVARDAREHTAAALLAVDGLITGAFASAKDPAELAALADRATTELLALGNGRA